MTAARSEVDFDGLRIGWDARVLEPRPWTALQSRWAAELLAGGPSDEPFLEVCCGAGHIGLLAVALSGRPLVAVDLDPVACAWTRTNAEAAGLAHLVEVRQGHLEDVEVPATGFGLVVADPPWVPRAEVATYPDDPTLAIDGGDDGLDLARAVLLTAARVLRPGGRLLLQLGGPDQVDRLGPALDSGGWVRDEVRTGERGVVAGLVLVDRSTGGRGGESRPGQPT